MTIRLPRLPDNYEKHPQLFRRYWDEAMNSIEDALNQILSLPEIQQAIEDLDAAVIAANEAAEAANDAADAAQTTADEQRSEGSIINSYIGNFTAPLISADSSGNVTIANHDRFYGDSTLNPTVSVTGDTIATTATSTQIVRVYYDDASRAGGAVTYLYTIDPAAPPVQEGNRHSVGAVEIPAAGSADGSYVKPRGWVDWNEPAY